MPAPVFLTDILTDDERMAWHARDHIEFFAWYSRWTNVEISRAEGKIVPRHRYNKKHPHLP